MLTNKKKQSISLKAQPTAIVSCQRFSVGAAVFVRWHFAAHTFCVLFAAVVVLQVQANLCVTACVFAALFALAVRTLADFRLYIRRKNVKTAARI